MQIMSEFKTQKKICDEINGFLLFGEPELIVKYLMTNDVGFVQHTRNFLSRFQHFCHCCNMGFENGRGWKSHLFSRKHEANQFKLIIMRSDRKELVCDKNEVKVTSLPLCDANGTISVKLSINESLNLPFYVKFNTCILNYTIRSLYTNENFIWNEDTKKEEGCIKHELNFLAQNQFGHHFYPVIFKFDTNYPNQSIFIMRLIELDIVGKLYEKLAPKEAYRKKEKPFEIPSNIVEIGGIPLPPLTMCQLNFREIQFEKNEYDVERFFKDNESINNENYHVYMSILLNAEESQLDKDIRFYDMLKVKFEDKRRKTFLTLNVPGCIENRPAVLLGDRVYIYLNKSRSKRYEAIVHEISNGSLLKLGLSDEFPFISNMVVDVEFTHNNEALNLMRESLDIVSNQMNLFENILFPQPKSINIKTESLDSLTWYDQKLNEQQRKAVINIKLDTSYPCPFIIYGPPGTGKTVTLVEAVKQIWKSTSCGQIIACAPNNLSADLLVERLLQHIEKSNILRLYNRTRSYSQVPSLLKDCCNFNKLNQELYFPSKEKLSSYRILVCTFVTYGHILALSDFQAKNVTHLFIDEAAQALESEVIIPISHIIPQNPQLRVILAGDPKQLGAIVHSSTAKDHYFDRSFLERLVTETEAYCKKHGHSSNRTTREDNFFLYDENMCVKLLNNYRSHKSIIEIPKKLFYNDQLNECAGEFRELFINMKAKFLPNQNFPLLFHPIYGKEEREADSPSYFNIAEVETIGEYLDQLLDDRLRENKLKFLQASQIGIISPYRGQLKKIRQMIDNKNYKNSNEIKIGSVEEFQGQEKCVIIISSVRSLSSFTSNERKLKIGFLNNPKRFNVAITRAQALVILVGNPFMLKADKYWEVFLKYLKENKAWVNLSSTKTKGKNDFEYQELANLFDKMNFRNDNGKKIYRLYLTLG